MIVSITFSTSCQNRKLVSPFVYILIDILIYFNKNNFQKLQKTAIYFKWSVQI